LTRLVLVNVVYFKGTWLYPFSECQTSICDFYTDETNKVQVPIMHIVERYAFAKLEDLDAQLLQLDYKVKEILIDGCVQIFV
jgi:serine protease inhibitor